MEDTRYPEIHFTTLNEVSQVQKDSRKCKNNSVFFRLARNIFAATDLEVKVLVTVK